ncbi:MAG: 23S rRNA (pseudouridine(1915)-N(3))-methyltransferase RlmH [Gammaproteobacteria bacterium]|nr:23S rRNA (pseudouridine(1915)-N(3))-methyltransferase RlmH [Gammaproteobacteria bacterium]
MRIHLIAVGKKMPEWVNSGFSEFSKRMPPELQINLVEITPSVRNKTTPIEKNIKEEGKRIQSAIPSNSRLIVLDEKGKKFSSIELSKKMEEWFPQGQDIAIVIGGADGIDDRIKQQADETWSLSSFTLPHALVRVVVAEQLYRAWSILKGHPYHRE